MKKEYGLLAFMVIFLNGCSAARHVDELLTLKRLSNEQSNIKTAVEVQDERFETMLGLISSPEWDAYKDKKMIMDAFGAPVIKRQEVLNDQILDVWLYRYATRFFDSPKIYLYFDSGGKLVDSKWLKAPK